MEKVDDDWGVATYDETEPPSRVEILSFCSWRISWDFSRHQQSGVSTPTFEWQNEGNIIRYVRQGKVSQCKVRECNVLK